MCREKLEAILEDLGIPYRYFMFEKKEAVEPPFLVWYLPGTRNFSADGKVYCQISKLNLELYTDKKDFELERKLETILKEEELFWNKTEGFLDDEQMYEVLYEMEVVIDG